MLCETLFSFVIRLPVFQYEHFLYIFVETILVYDTMKHGTGFQYLAKIHGWFQLL